MGAFEYRQAEEIRDALARHGVRYLFIGKSGAIILGFPDTTQDADLFVEKSPASCAGLVTALRELGFELDPGQEAEVRRGKDFIQLRNGPFDLDLVFALGWHRELRGYMVATGRGARISRVPPARHHRQQGRGEQGEGSGVAAEVEGVLGVLEEGEW
ncbi:MAG: hypothetical protein U0575_05470 [Phycisphaerales bacterium]